MMLLQVWVQREQLEQLEQLPPIRDTALEQGPIPERERVLVLRVTSVDMVTI